jgi:DUF4097 and DUF4098 domain-containing protein YvlB
MSDITQSIITMKKLWVWAVALSLSAPVWAAEANAEGLIRKSFNVAAGGKLTIRADRGSIQVKTAPVDKVEIEVTREPGPRAASDVLQRHTVSFSQQGNDVSVKAEMDKAKRSFWRGDDLRVRYAVTVPNKYNVNLKTAGGSIAVQDIEGEANSETSGGSIKFGQINGPVFGRTSGGSIELNGCTRDVDLQTSGGGIHVGDTSGNVVARTSGGSIHIGRTKGAVTAETSGGGIDVNGAAGPVNAHTSGGSIRATLTEQPTAECTLETSGGGIELKLAEKIAVDLDAHTSGGKVTTEFPVLVQGEMKPNQVRSKVNGGGPKLTLGTSGGSIKIRKL